jgi:hypothetical protein
MCSNQGDYARAASGRTDNGGRRWPPPAATGRQRVPRPNVAARLDMLRAALGGHAEGDDEDDVQFLLRTVLLLTSPMVWLYWKDCLGLDPAAAAETAGWAINTAARAR